jgi:hypothetical protein
VRKEEADAAVMRREGAARHTALIAQMQKIPAYLCLAQLIGRAPVERGKTADALQIDLLG